LCNLDELQHPSQALGAALDPELPVDVLQMLLYREEVIRELAEQFRPVMERSPDGVYLWLDEAQRRATSGWPGSSVPHYTTPQFRIERIVFSDTTVTGVN